MNTFVSLAIFAVAVDAFGIHTAPADACPSFAEGFVTTPAVQLGDNTAIMFDVGGHDAPADFVEGTTFIANYLETALPQYAMTLSDVVKITINVPSPVDDYDAARAHLATLFGAETMPAVTFATPTPGTGMDACTGRVTMNVVANSDAKTYTKGGVRAGDVGYSDGLYATPATQDAGLDVQVVDIMEQLEGIFDKLGLSMDTLVIVTAWMEAGDDIDGFNSRFSDMNAAYNKWMDGKVLPSMFGRGITLAKEPPAGVTAQRLMMDATSVADPIRGLPSQPTAPVSAVSLNLPDFVLPFAIISGQGDRYWHSGVLMNGAKMDDNVTTQMKAVISVVNQTLAELDMTLEDVVSADLLITVANTDPASMAKIVETYNDAFGALRTPPTFSVAIVKWLGGGIATRLELTTEIYRDWSANADSGN